MTFWLSTTPVASTAGSGPRAAMAKCRPSLENATLVPAVSTVLRRPAVTCLTKPSEAGRSSVSPTTQREPSQLSRTAP